MQMHAPRELPTETGLWMCECGEKEPHGTIVTTGGFTGPVTTKRNALVYVDTILRHKYVNDVEAERIRQQIAESPLKEPLPNDFHACSKCWIPVKHGHFMINDEEVGVKFSIRGAIVELGHLKETAKLTDEDMIRIGGQIDDTNLPETSDVDILMMAQEEVERRKQEHLDSTLLMLTTVLEMAVKRHSQMGSSPVFPPLADPGNPRFN